MRSRKVLSVLLIFATLLTSLAIPAFADAERTEAANNVIDMIMALNTNTKPDDLVAVKDAYAALTPEEQQSVFNYSSLVEFEQDYAKTVNDELAAIDLKEFDLFSGEKVVDSLTARYNALSDEAKALVTQIEKLGELENKLYSLHEFMGMRPVSVLNSTMRGLAEYDLASVRTLAEAPSEGIY